MDSEFCFPRILSYHNNPKMLQVLFRALTSYACICIHSVIYGCIIKYSNAYVAATPLRAPKKLLRQRYMLFSTASDEALLFEELQKSLLLKLKSIWNLSNFFFKTLRINTDGNNDPFIPLGGVFTDGDFVELERRKRPDHDLFLPAISLCRNWSTATSSRRSAAVGRRALLLCCGAGRAFPWL